MKTKNSSFKKLKPILLDKLGITNRHLNRLIEREAQRLPGTREEALWSLCYINTIPLNQHLNKIELCQFRKNVKQNVGIVLNMKPGRDLNMAKRNISTINK